MRVYRGHEIGYAELQIESITGTPGDLMYVPPRFLEVISPASTPSDEPC
jgi:hypothetical protein